VSDDGAGYDASSTPMGSGLRNMADRLAALGGTLRIQSERGRGTVVSAWLPQSLTKPSTPSLTSHATPSANSEVFQ
jgi:signal transduction histidine kinase